MVECCITLVINLAPGGYVLETSSLLSQVFIIRNLGVIIGVKVCEGF